MSQCDKWICQCFTCMKRNNRNACVRRRRHAPGDKTKPKGLYCSTCEKNCASTSVLSKCARRSGRSGFTDVDLRAYYEMFPSVQSLRVQDHRDSPNFVVDERDRLDAPMTIEQALLLMIEGASKTYGVVHLSIKVLGSTRAENVGMAGKKVPATDAMRWLATMSATYAELCLCRGDAAAHVLKKCLSPETIDLFRLDDEPFISLFATTKAAGREGVVTRPHSDASTDGDRGNLLLCLNGFKAVNVATVTEEDLEKDGRGQPKYPETLIDTERSSSYILRRGQALFFQSRHLHEVMSSGDSLALSVSSREKIKTFA
jgi:hypothetical protein